MKVDYITHYGTDLSVVNAARVSFANQSDWQSTVFDTEDEAHDFAEKVDGHIDSDYIYSDRWMGGYPVDHLSARDAKLVAYLADAGHTSCFEHQGATLRLKVPIFIARQIQRHRTFSYNEVSRRYVDTPPEFFWPSQWRKRADNVKQGSSDEVVSDMNIEGGGSTTPQQLAEASLRHNVFTYENMLRSGVAPELARMILPQNMYTEFYMTGNLRAWSHFLQLRLDAHAQIEVQEVAKQVEEILRPLFPVSMKALIK